MTWMDQVTERGVAAVARAVGLEVGGQSGNVNRGISPCPSCGATQRGRRDRRGPIGIRPDDLGWRCHRCDAHGSPLNLASWTLVGLYKPNGSGWAELQTACADAGLCDTPTRAPTGIRARSVPRAIGDAGSCARTRPPAAAARRTPAPPTHSPIRPPAAEVARLWTACRPVTQDDEVASWLAARGLEPERCAGRNLVRALPRDATLPGWACFGRPWTLTSHRVIVPMYGPDGALETLHARALSPRDPKGRDKAASPKGAQIAGTIMTDDRARALLTAGRSEHTTSKTYTLVPNVTLLVAEGVPDFLTWATHFDGEDPTAPAVVGIIAGSWSSAIAARIPDGARILIRTHDDSAGHKYARQIGDTLRNRCQVFCRQTENEGRS